jgi:uncharacterized membrane protein
MSRARAVLWFVHLLAGGLYAGFLVAVLFTEVALRGFGAAVYVQVEQVKHLNLNQLAAGCLTAILGSGLLLLLGPRRGPPKGLILAAVGCALLALAVTLTVNVPINAAQMIWDPQAPPQDWAVVRDRWQAAHVLRTAAAVIGFGCQIVAVLRGPEPPLAAVGKRG